MGDALVTRLGVLGDVHAEDERLELALRFLEQQAVDTIVCTGDIVDGLGCPDRSTALLQETGVQTVRGNHDRWVLEDKARHVPDAHSRMNLAEETLEFLSALPTQQIVNTIRGDLLLCHGIADNDLKKVWPGTERMAIERCQVLDRLIDSDIFRFVINGHMHFRTMMHFERLTLINAGTLKGDRWPGFSVIDFATMTIVSYEFGAGGIGPAVSLSLEPLPGQTLWKDTQCFRGAWTPIRLFAT